MIKPDNAWDMKAASKRLQECIKKQKARKFPYAWKAWYGYKKDE